MDWIKFLSDNNNQAASLQNNKPRVSFLYGSTNLARVSCNQHPALLIWRGSNLMRTTPPGASTSATEDSFQTSICSRHSKISNSTENLVSTPPEFSTISLNYVESDLWSRWSFLLKLCSGSAEISFYFLPNQADLIRRIRFSLYI